MPIRTQKFKKENHYHITNRGLSGKKIFHEHNDYKWFLEKMIHYQSQYFINITCHCLMPNHFHLIAKQSKENGLLKFISYLQASHSRHFNSKWNRKGQLFENRYHAKHIKTQDQLINTIKYIIDNPVKAKLVTKPSDWPFLSFNLPYIDNDDEFPGLGFTDQ